MSDDPLSHERLEDLLADVICARDISGDGLETVIKLINYYENVEADRKNALAILKRPEQIKGCENEQHPQDRQDAPDDGEHQ